jgi:long-chain acyl-CoA synthetase
MPAAAAHVLDEDAAIRRAAAVLARLAAAGIQAGDRVAVLAGSTADFVAARDAATAADLVLAPINPRLAPPEIAWIVGHARPRALLVDGPHLAAARAAIADRPVPVIELDGAQAAGPATDLARIGATLLYTSGTTGRPKGCWRPAAAETARADELRASYGLARSDVHLIACPLAHSAPGIFLRAARAAGARTIILPRSSPEGLLAAARAHRATVCFLVPTQVHRLLALAPDARGAAPPDLRVIVAGAPFAPAVKAGFAAWLGPGRLHEFYGSSETGTVTVIGPDDGAAHPGSVGRPPPGISLRVLDDAGAACPPGAVGEVHVRSAALMAGYLGGDGVALTRPGERDGHVTVGDLGRVDGGGWLTLVDRKHDTIISGGMNVYPAEVERALASYPEVAGAVAFGIDDADWGQIVAAVVALRPGGRADAAALRAHLRAALAGYKLPRALAFCDLAELPVGASGKALRRAARAAFAGRLRRADR